MIPQVHMLVQVVSLQGLLPANMPPAATIKAQAQLCVQSVWLELGPVLLSLCRRSSGEAAGADDVADLGPVSDPGMLGLSPREVFATYSKLLADLLVLRGRYLRQLLEIALEYVSRSISLLVRSSQKSVSSQYPCLR